MQDKEWLTVENIYEILNGSVPLDTIRAWIRSKKLPAYRPGKAYLVKREDLKNLYGIAGRRGMMGHDLFPSPIIVVHNLSSAGFTQYPADFGDALVSWSFAGVVEERHFLPLHS